MLQLKLKFHFIEYFKDIVREEYVVDSCTITSNDVKCIRYPT